jgi:hypothetical protein
MQAILGCVLKGAPEWLLLHVERKRDMAWNTAITFFLTGSMLIGHEKLNNQPK